MQDINRVVEGECKGFVARKFSASGLFNTLAVGAVAATILVAGSKAENNEVETPAQKPVIEQNTSKS